MPDRSAAAHQAHGDVKGPRWQYMMVETKPYGGIFKTVGLMLDDEKYEGDSVVHGLNEYGMQGWELTGVIPWAGMEGHTSSVHLIFKRRLA